MRGRLVPLAASICAGVALWLSFGALAVTDAAPGAPRIGLLPPLWTLAASVAGAATAAIALRLTPSRSLPLFVTGLLLLPWLPGRVPAVFLIWTGPAAWCVWIVTIAWMVGSSQAARALVTRAGWLRHPSRAPVAAATIALALYGGAAWRLSPIHPGGDEPHYLIIAQSLLTDGDLRIENNHARGDFTAYLSGSLKPDYLRRGGDGAIYSIHAPGLPAIVAPAFALLGYPGVIAFLAAVSALSASLVWIAAYRVTASAGAAWFGWSAVALSAPFFCHAFTVYPDAMGAGLVMVAVLALVDEETGRDRGWVLPGAALAILPWLHTRFLVLAVMLGAAILIRLGQRRAWRDAATLMSMPLISAAGWFAFFYAVYGTFNPSAPYGGYTQSALRYVRVGLPALLFDQQFGLLANAPIYAFAMAGFIALARRRPRPAIELAAALVPYVLVVAGYRMWWGGRSAPARFLVPALLPLGVAAAALWAEARAASTRAVGALLLLASTVVTGVLVLVDGGRLLYNVRDGYALWLEWLSPLVNLPLGVPSYLRQPPTEALYGTAIWGVALGAAALTLRALAHRAAGGAPIAAALSGLALAGMIAVTASWAAEAPVLTQAPAQLRLLDRVGSARGAIAIEYRPFALLSADSAISRLRISSDLRRPAPAAPPALALADVPAGAYRLRVEPSTRSTTLALDVGHSVQPLHAWPVAAAGADASYEFTLPVGVRTLAVRSDQTVARATLEPVAIVPPGLRLARARAERATRYGDTNVFFLDARASMEPSGFWVEGGHTARLVFARPAAARAILFLRNAPVENRVVIRAGGWADTLRLAAREERLIDVPLTREAATLLSVAVDRGFRPALAEPGNLDYRNLGCWIELK